MKKINFFSCLKVALIIILLNVSTSVFANPNSKLSFEFNKQFEKAQSLLSNHTSFFKGESRLEISVLSFYNLKKPIKLNYLGLNPVLKLNSKTSKLNYYWIYPITPSLKNTELIYPFHSFL